LDGAGTLDGVGTFGGTGTFAGVLTFGGVDLGGVVIAVRRGGAHAIEPRQRPRGQFRRPRPLHLFAVRAYSLVP
jgi:hypothetical protein